MTSKGFDLNPLKGRIIERKKNIQRGNISNIQQEILRKKNERKPRKKSEFMQSVGESREEEDVREEEKKDVSIKKKPKKIKRKKIILDNNPTNVDDENIEGNIEKSKQFVKKSKNITKGTLTKKNMGKNLSELILDDTPFSERLSKPNEIIKIKAPSYYMNNRAIFINFINSLFEPYKKEIADDTKDITCDTIEENKKKGFELLVHQKIIKDYINIFSPYRGLLLYHGLGAGKTCASIGIAEGIKHKKKIMVFTPASLRANYISELKFCGDSIYKKNQYWEFIKIDNTDTEIINAM